MKSKQQTAKEAQNYTKTQNNCGNCKHFKFETEILRGGYVLERNLRCGIGGFKVHKTARCDKWELNNVIK